MARREKLVVDKFGHECYYKAGFKKDGEWVKGRMITKDFIALDIETSNNHEEDTDKLRTFPFILQVVIGSGDHKEGHYFRTPEQLIMFLKSVYHKYGLYQNDSFNKYMVVYVHNLSYELSYLTPYIRTLPDNPDGDMEITKGRNDNLEFIWGGFCFRCSKYLSNRSLDKWSKDLQTTHKKQIGKLDYSKILYPDSRLTDAEIEYSMEDVWVLHECVEKQMELFGDNLMTIPLTATGYVRREFEAACDEAYKENIFRATRLTPDMFIACERAYSGGYTHNNRYYSDMTIKAGDVITYLGQKIEVPLIGHRDFKSHYPSQMRARKFPMTKFRNVYQSSTGFPMTIDNVIKMSKNHDFSTLSIIEFTHAHIKDKSISMPFMQLSKCFKENNDPDSIHKIIYGQSCFDGKLILDNGRILSATGSWKMVVDDYLLEILNDQYEMTYTILSVNIAHNEYLPKNIADIIDNYFKKKTDLKEQLEAAGEQYGEASPEYRRIKKDLQVVKALLNSIYGCCVTSPNRDEFKIGEDMTYPIVNFDKTIEDKLNEFYNNPKSCLPYQWGVWVTAAAKYELYEFMMAIGYDKCLYADTDSIFYIKDDETERKIADLNASKRALAPCVRLDNGQDEYYDEFTAECDLVAFRGLHSKCYGVITKSFVNKKGKLIPEQLNITIAGVSEKAMVDIVDDKPVYVTREQELMGKTKDIYKALDKLTDGCTFTKTAGLSALYIGAEGKTGADGNHEIMTIDIIDKKTGKIHTVSTAGGCVLKPLDKKVVHTIDPITEGLELILPINNMFD